MKNLDKDKIKEYLEKHLPYRLNSLRAYDLYLDRRSSSSKESETDRNKCNWESEYLEPAFEISTVFGRVLLHFLGIKRDNNKLKNIYQGDEKDNEVMIWDVNPSKGPYLISNFSNDEEQDLVNLIKVSNKATAHLTLNTSTKEELSSLENARSLIYNAVLNHVEGLCLKKIWWFNEKQ